MEEKEKEKEDESNYYVGIDIVNRKERKMIFFEMVLAGDFPKL